MIFFPLYIDPGTGSALFSIAIGVAAAAYFLVRTVFLKCKVLLFRQKNEQHSQYTYVIYAEEKRYWMFFKPVLDEFESRQTEVLYLTSSEDDPVFTSPYSFVKGKYIGQGNKAFAYLNFLSADIVLATTPDLDVLQWKRSKTVKHYCHMIHAISGLMFYRLFGLDYYDSIVLSGENEIPEIRSLEAKRGLSEKQLVVVGNTYFDMYRERIKNIPVENDKPFTVLVSPSWGPSALHVIYGEKLLTPLAETGWRIIVRPHPQSVISEKSMLEKLVEKYKNNSNIEWDYNPENIYTLAKSDIMISDFSGIIFDYIFLFDRPVLSAFPDLDFRIYDAHNLEQEPSFYQLLKSVCVELNESKLNDIRNIILGLGQNTVLRKNREEAKRIMWRYQGEAAKRIVDFMTATANANGNDGAGIMPPVDTRIAV